MNTSTAETLPLTDLAPEPGDTRAEFLAGLRATPKRIAPKFFYDARGSQLFDRICTTADYYPTRTETAILHDALPEIAATCGPRCRLVELGSGSSTKTRLLLDHLEDIAGYVPIDISRPHLIAAAERLRASYPDLEILPVCADYAQPVTLPATSRPAGRTVLFFPGSTIGNFTPDAATTFLRRLRSWVADDDRLLLGIDLVKDAAVLEAAYNDREGVTAAFNLNLLHRANREFGADFDVARFRHEAVYDAPAQRIEMRLVSQSAQTVRLAGETIRFAAGEAIVTEHSCKYSPDGFAALAARAGWQAIRRWHDPRRWFGVFAFEPISASRVRPPTP